MTDTLIARLRDTASKGVSVWGDLQMEAADRIEALQAEVEQLTRCIGDFEGVDRRNIDLIAERDALQSEIKWLTKANVDHVAARVELREEVERLTAEKKAAAMNYEAEIDRLKPWAILSAVELGEKAGKELAEMEAERDALQSRLTALEKQEPAAWAMKRSDGLLLDIITVEEHARIEGDYTIPLYLVAGAAPPNATQ